MRTWYSIGFLVLVMCMVTGCFKPYDKPEFVEIDSCQTAYMIPLEGPSGDQVKLDSAEAYENYKIMTKRLLIPKRWNKTGRLPNTGTWIPTVRVITCDRTPITREWQVGADNGTSKKDQGIWAESSDSIGFSTGFNCTAYISENDTSKYLYWYPSNSLSEVMDGEIRNMVQQTVSEVAARYNMDNLREKKLEIISEVRKVVLPFYAERGITITTIGQFGGFAYENPAIQTTIDAVFVAQQEKAKEASLLSAMESKKSRMLQEGTAEANKIEEIAKGRAKAVLQEKEAEATGITLVNNALKEAQSNPLFVKIKSLEVEAQRIQKWNGEAPRFMMGGNADFVPLMQIETAEVTK